MLLGVVGGTQYWLTDFSLSVAQRQARLGVMMSLSAAAYILTFYISVALVAQLTLDKTHGRPARTRQYFATAFRSLVPLTGLGLLASALFGVLFFWIDTVPGPIAFALIAIGFCVLCALTLVVPAMVIEGAKFRAFGRTAELSKGYRWPILGTLFLLVMCSVILLVLGTFLIGVSNLFLTPGWEIFSVLTILAVFVSLAFSFGGVGVGLIYARLTEMKEGAGPEALAEVFD